ncbi:MAG: MoxR family ATPase [Proteobacteria bacterium]|nr:MoxR family ATPase [Pseudomonadota bacterium]
MSPEETLQRLRHEVGRVLVGQRGLVDGLLVGLLSNGHVLVEGVPGLAKTTAVRTLAAALGLDFRRVQFTPDLLPGDLTGNPVFVPDRGEFEVRKGPLFTSVLLADEINRAPAKVQSALLEAMEERQITIGGETLRLPDPFLVMATQNPVELEGTYALPEAQLDRFLLKLVVDYPSEEEELEIVTRDQPAVEEVAVAADAAAIRDLRDAAEKIFVAPELGHYAVRIARATREARPAPFAGTEMQAVVELGASPRAAKALIQAARARALLEGREFATPHDVKHMAPQVLAHRMAVTVEAEADGITARTVLDAILASVPAP